MQESDIDIWCDFYPTKIPLIQIFSLETKKSGKTLGNYAKFKRQKSGRVQGKCLFHKTLHKALYF
jgi:hypothetical protein